MQTQTKITGQAKDLAVQTPTGAPEPKWAAVIDDQCIPAPRRKLKVRVLLEQMDAKPGSVLVRDLNSEHDIALHSDQEIDLADGNTFYLVPECEAPKPGGGHAPGKLAFVVDDRPEETPRGDQTGRTLRDLFGLAPEVLLFRDYQSPHDQPIGLDDVARFVDGPVFYTRRDKPTEVKITINGEHYVLDQEKASVRELKQLASIPLADVLVKVEKGQLKELPDDAVVELHCGDMFVSHPRDNSSS